jgi:hypothetical protein
MTGSGHRRKDASSSSIGSEGEALINMELDFKKLTDRLLVIVLLGTGVLLEKLNCLQILRKG